MHYHTRCVELVVYLKAMLIFLNTIVLLQQMLVFGHICLLHNANFCLFDQMKRYSHEALKPRDLRSTSVSILPAL